MIHHGEPAYPRRLAGVRHAPAVLHVRGRLEDRVRAVAVVGARAARAEDVKAACALARALAGRGMLVVSGGALGVDAAAHCGALDAGGPTWAVLGCGIDVIYPPRNRALFERLVEHGAVLSQFSADAPPRPGHFVARNATMAGLADAVVVIGAGARSGALHTARAASRFGRVVCAHPGSEGADALLAEGAALVRDAADVERALDGRPARPSIDIPEAGTPAGKVLAFLHENRAHDADAIAHGTGLMVREVSRALTSLELDGLAILMPGRTYLRSTLAHELLAR